MKSTVEQLNPTRVKVTVEVPFAELEPDFDKAYKALAGQVNIPGFRKGKAPAKLLESRIGRPAVLEQVINDMIPARYSAAIEEHDLKVLAQPEIEVTKLEDNDVVEFTAEVDVRPEITLPKYEELEVTVEAPAADDSAVDTELDNLRARFGTLKGVERGAEEGDFLSVDLAATVDGEAVEEASTEGLSYELGSGTLVEGLDDAAKGLKAGESKEFPSSLVAGEFAGKEALITVTVQSVKERELPEADDDFAQMASEFDTIAELRESLAGQAKEKGAFAQGSAARDKLVEQLLEAVELPVPQSLIDDEVHRHLEQENRLEDDEHRAEVVEASEKQFRTQLLFDRIAKDLEVQVSQEEFTQYLIQASGQYGMSPQDFIQALQQGNQLQAVMGDVARNKAIAVVLGKAEVVDTNGDAVNLEGFAAVEGEDDEDASDEDASEESADTAE